MIEDAIDARLTLLPALNYVRKVSLLSSVVFLWRKRYE
jgi:hypothetical protein